MKYLFTGTQSTGKSTILQYYKEKGVNVVTEVVRNLSKTKGVKVNELGDEEGQKIIFETYKDILSNTNNYISDRSMIDVAAYTQYLVCKGAIHPSILWEQLAELDDFVNDNPDAVFFYFPIEFPVVDDGFRSLDEEFRKNIDNNIKNILDSRGIPYIEVRGTVDERINLINTHMNMIQYPL
jgi:nicotinamide riboside kinase